MKNEKEFDFDKKKPNFEGSNFRKSNIIEKERIDDISSILNKSQNSKNIEVIQKDSFIDEKKLKKIDNNKYKSEMIQTNLNEPKKEEEIKTNIIVSLPESQIISPDLPLEEAKVPNKNFSKNLVENIFEKQKSEINEGIIDGVEIGLNNVMDNIHDDIQENKIQIKNIDKQINDLSKNNISSINRNKGDYETLIKIQKINELNQTKKSIEKQINKVDENMKTIKDEKIFNDANKLNIPYMIIDQNIKKDKMKENKAIKELLISKLNGINEQVNKLMENEKEFKVNKKINVKEFLENFEKDKIRLEKQARKYSAEKKQREQRLLNNILKDEKKIKENEDLINKENDKKKKELEKIRLQELERLREKKREKKEKIDHIREHANDKAENENKYLFRVLERKYNEKVEQELKKEIMKKREKMKEGRITLVEIVEFDKKQKELELKRLVEIEEEKKKLKEKWKQTKENLPKFESSLTQKLKEEENQKKEKIELEQYKKQSKMKEIKNYSQTVQKLFLPKINENIKKERENRIKNLRTKDNIHKIQRKKNNGRILLVKPDPNKPKKYSWKLKLEPEKRQENYNNSIQFSKNENQNLRSKSADKKHKPMKKLPDYLTEMRLEKDKDRHNNISQRKHREYNWDKMLKSGNLAENLEKIKQKAEVLENKAKMNELLLNNSGKDDIELQQKVSDCLIDAINAKLSILDNFGKYK